MKVVTESTENRQTVLNIEIEPQEMEESLDKAYHRLVKGINVPGFRKGKAPRSILENYIGKEELQKEALDSLIPQLCNQAIEEQKIDIIAQPQIEVLQVDPIVIQLTCSLRPEVTLGEYHNISLAPEPVEVSEEQVNKVLEQIQERQAVLNPVERPVAFEDLAIIDLEEREEGGEEESVDTHEGLQYPVIQGSGFPLPGFAEELVGLAKGEEKNFLLSYPDDYQIEELAGKKSNFKVKVVEVKEKCLPELDDEFAKSLGQDYETIDALRESVVTNLKNIAEDRSQREFEQGVIEAAVDLASVEFPPVLVEHEIDRFLSERDRMLSERGGMENYLKYINKTEEEIREELRPDAVISVTQSLVLGKVAEEEKIEASKAEIDTEIENMLQNAGEGGEELRKMLDSERGRLWIEERLIVRKTVQCLTEIATKNAAEAVTGDSTETAADENAETAIDNSTAIATDENTDIIIEDSNEIATGDTAEEKE